MKKKVINIRFFCAIIMLAGICIPQKITAFDWPQTTDRAYILFSQIRAQNFNTGIVFSGPGEVVAAENGFAVMELKNNISDMGWFESPLGNTVILAHNNNILSVYGNLTNTKIDPNNRAVNIGDVIGISGESAWKEGNDGLEFQIIDTRMQTAINPIILMDVPLDEIRIPITDVIAVSRTGEEFALYNGISLAAGVYTLYMKRPQTGMIQNTRVMLNGEIKESLSYDTLKQFGTKLAVNGNQIYEFDTIYPNNNVIRLTQIIFSQGTNTVELFVTGVGNTQSTARYRITGR